VLPLCYDENPRIYLGKKQENDEKRMTYKMLKKVKMKFEIYATGTSTQKNKVLCNICINFFTVQGYFEHTGNLQAG